MLRLVLKYSLNHHKLLKQRQLSSIDIVRKYSTQNPGTEELIVKEKIHLSKPSVTKWKRPPFVKNFFVGKFDIELLAFPEILNNEQLNELETIVASLNIFFKGKVNSLEIDENKTIPKDLLQELKDLGLFGRMIPTEYGGLDLTHTACTRLNEVLGLDWSVAATLLAHEFLAAQTILLAGTKEQKNKYLPDLACGNRIAAMCCSESKSGCDLLAMDTHAAHTIDGSSFIISGNKSWVTNAQSADCFIVYAKIPNEVNAEEEEVSCFIVDKDTEGVTIEPYEKTSLQGIETAMVRFKEVKIPSSNMLGVTGAGYEIFLKVLENFRLNLSSCAIGVLKSLLDSVTEYVIHAERWSRSLGDVQLVRERLSRINSTIYTMESISYFTAGLLDSSENPDAALETAIAKVFNSEATLFCLRELMSALGSSSFLKEQQMERFYRDAQALAVFEGSNDIARLSIGLAGCKYLGLKKAEEILKTRNSYFFPKDAMKKIIRNYRVSNGWVKYDQDLAGHIHPSLVESGNHLEECLQKFEVAMERILHVHGSKIVDTQLDPRRAANIAIDLYAMTAVLTRSSRSYCIGLKNADHEIKVAHTFCEEAYSRTLENITSLVKGPSFNSEGNHLILGEQVIDCKGYFPEHPLKYNFLG